MKNKKFTIALFLAPMAMFGFSYALIPLYDIFCDITGINGKTGLLNANEIEQVEVQGDYVNVSFLSKINSDAPLTVKPEHRAKKFNTGLTYTTYYTATNNTEKPMVIQAVPSVAPGNLAKYFKKVECFCFTQQEFYPNETRKMPLIFTLSSDLPDNVSSLAIAYTFYKVKKVGSEKNNQKHDSSNMEHASYHK